MRGAVLVACILGCLAASGHAAVPHAQSLAAASAPQAGLYVMQTPKLWAPTKDPSTEEAVPGLLPTDGFAINATTPNFERFAPVIETIRPLGPIVNQLLAYFNVSQYHPTLPGHNLKSKSSLTMLMPNAQALLRLPMQLAGSSSLKFGSKPWSRGQSVVPENVTLVKDPTKLGKVATQISKNMVLTRMVPYEYLNNQTQLTTRLGNPVSVFVTPDGTKYFKSGNITARIVLPNPYRMPMTATAVYMVDSFLVPPFFEI